MHLFFDNLVGYWAIHQSPATNGSISFLGFKFVLTFSILKVQTTVDGICFEMNGGSRFCRNSCQNK